MYPEISEGLRGSAAPESVFAWSLLLPLIGTGQSLMSCPRVHWRIMVLLPGTHPLFVKTTEVEEL